jgi:hypothetical protein
VAGVRNIADLPNAGAPEMRVDRVGPGCRKRDRKLIRIVQAKISWCVLPERRNRQLSHPRGKAKAGTGAKLASSLNAPRQASENAGKNLHIAQTKLCAFCSAFHKTELACRLSVL